MWLRSDFLVGDIINIEIGGTWNMPVLQIVGAPIWPVF